MRVLVHICCGPCAVTVLQRLMDDGHEPAGLFFNPNIQPLSEYMRRREGAMQVTEKLGVPLILADALPFAEQAWADEYCAGIQEEGPPDPGFRVPLPGLPPAVDPLPWLRAVAGQENRRCLFCWDIRLQKTIQIAQRRNFEGFTTSLLYSRYQAHERLRGMGEDLAASSGLSFIYQDFRTSWQQGIDISKHWGIYRQQYCGCIYSEYDRYSRDCRKACAGEGR